MGITDTVNMINKIVYNDIILSQEDVVCFRITEEEKQKG